MVLFGHSDTSHKHVKIMEYDKSKQKHNKTEGQIKDKSEVTIARTRAILNSLS